MNTNWESLNITGVWVTEAEPLNTNTGNHKENVTNAKGFCVVSFADELYV